MTQISSSRKRSVLVHVSETSKGEDAHSFSHDLTQVLVLLSGILTIVTMPFGSALLCVGLSLGQVAFFSLGSTHQQLQADVLSA